MGAPENEQHPASDAAPAQSDAAPQGPTPTASESSGTGDQAGGAVERHTLSVSVSTDPAGEGWTTLEGVAPADAQIAAQPATGTASLEPVEGQPEQTCVKVVNATGNTSVTVEVSVPAVEPLPQTPQQGTLEPAAVDGPPLGEGDGQVHPETGQRIPAGGLTDPGVAAEPPVGTVTCPVCGKQFVPAAPPVQEQPANSQEHAAAE